ncbi:hypothetical protein Gasu2_70230 [Galdieria sulphuraria]|nr:hypothetical protein Gasu2_70230 [Galdieria sulphuraria]
MSVKSGSQKSNCQLHEVSTILANSITNIIFRSRPEIYDEATKIIGFSDRELFEKRLYTVLYTKFSEKKTKIIKNLSYKADKKAEEMDESITTEKNTADREECSMELIAKGTSLSQELDSLLKLTQESSK